MERYISANKLKTIVSQLSSSPLNEWDTWGVMSVIDRTPSEDVAPVVRAHWEKFDLFVYNSDDEPVSKIGEVYRCSRCGIEEEEKYPYCHCGAKMDEETKE